MSFIRGKAFERRREQGKQGAVVGGSSGGEGGGVASTGTVGSGNGSGMDVHWWLIVGMGWAVMAEVNNSKEGGSSNT